MDVTWLSQHGSGFCLADSLFLTSSMARMKVMPCKGAGEKGKDTCPGPCKNTEPPALVDPPVPAQETPPDKEELTRRITEAEQLGDMGRSPVISNLTVGPDGCSGWAIYTGREGASQEEALTYHTRPGPPEGIPQGWSGEEAPKVPTGDSHSS